MADTITSGRSKAAQEDPDGGSTCLVLGEHSCDCSTLVRRKRDTHAASWNKTVLPRSVLGSSTLECGSLREYWYVPSMSRNTRAREHLQGINALIVLLITVKELEGRPATWGSSRETPVA